MTELSDQDILPDSFKETGASLDISPESGVFTSQEAIRANIDRNKRSWAWSIRNILAEMPNFATPNLLWDEPLYLWMGKQFGISVFRSEKKKSLNDKEARSQVVVATDYIRSFYHLRPEDALKYVCADQAGAFEGFKTETKQAYWKRMMGEDVLAHSKQKEIA